MEGSKGDVESFKQFELYANKYSISVKFDLQEHFEEI